MICFLFGIAPWVVPPAMNVLPRTLQHEALGIAVYFWYAIMFAAPVLYPLRLLRTAAPISEAAPYIIAAAMGIAYIVLGWSLRRWNWAIVGAIALACAQAVICIAPVVRYPAMIVSPISIIPGLWFYLTIRVALQLRQALLATRSQQLERVRGLDVVVSNHADGKSPDHPTREAA